MRLTFRENYKTQRRKALLRKLCGIALTSGAIVAALAFGGLLSFEPGRRLFSVIIIACALLASSVAIGARRERSTRTIVEWRS